jgi:lipoprotein-anchoring transpeptidase ErfK/SrfK
MSALRVLAFSYLAAASLFLLAAALQARPDVATALARTWHVLAEDLTARIWDPALGFARRQDVALLDTLDGPSARLDLAPPGPNDARTLAHVTLPPVRRAPLDDRYREPEFSAAVSVLIAPDLPPERIEAPAAPAAPGAEAAPPAAKALAALPPIPASPRAVAAGVRLAAGLSPELMKSFDLFLYVSKAAEGPLAQRMYVFRKEDGRLMPIYDWAASTGREARETDPHGRKTFTATPAGYYELDPGRMYRRYRSRAWDQPMPHAMFFNWEREGLQTGLAIHAASGADIALLGKRASAGCVHLSPEHARTLFSLIRKDYAGEVPRFAYDRRTATMANDGRLAHDAKGRLVMTDGYKVLIVIEDYAGGDDVVAALF